MLGIWLFLVAVAVILYGRSLHGGLSVLLGFPVVLMVRNLGKRTKYHVASEPQPRRREEVLYKIAQDISHVSDMQGILALVFSVALTGAIIYTLVKATSTEAMTGIIQILVPIVTMIVGFYFGKKGREEAVPG
jgi:hypothetical protein